VIVSYRRLSTDKQDIGLDAQKVAIDSYLALKGWTLDEDFVEKQSAKNMRRPELQKAIERVERSKGARILIVAKLDRLSRSVKDFATLVERANAEHWQIVVCDLSIDMTTPSGRLIANIMASLSEWERQMIGVRTKEALAEKRKQGIRPGKPVSDDHARLIHTLHKGGASLRTIANYFNMRNIPTAGGGKEWYASTVRGVLRRAA
jgi:DNA invertase Pin-like site-specific DNA recombinase